MTKGKSLYGALCLCLFFLLLLTPGPASAASILDLGIEDDKDSPADAGRIRLDPDSRLSLGSVFQATTAPFRAGTAPRPVLDNRTFHDSAAGRKDFDHPVPFSADLDDGDAFEPVSTMGGKVMNAGPLPTEEGTLLRPVRSIQFSSTGRTPRLMRFTMNVDEYRNPLSAVERIYLVTGAERSGLLSLESSLSPHADPVPVPGSLVLLASGFAGFVGLRRRLAKKPS